MKKYKTEVLKIRDYQNPKWTQTIPLQFIEKIEYYQSEKDCKKTIQDKDNPDQWTVVYIGKKRMNEKEEKEIDIENLDDASKIWVIYGQPEIEEFEEKWAIIKRKTKC